MSISTSWKQKSGLEQRLEKKDVNSFHNSIDNNKEKITYFKAKNNRSTKKHKNSKTLSKMRKSLDTIVVTATTSSFFLLSLAGFGLVVIAISSFIACGLTNSYKKSYELVMQKNSKYKKLYENDKKTIKSFNKSHRKSSQDNVIDKSECEFLWNGFIKDLDETKGEPSFKFEHKNENRFFNNNKLKINLGPTS